MLVKSEKQSHSIRVTKLKCNEQDFVKDLRSKINSQTHIGKFEIFHFLDNFSKITMIQNFFYTE